MVIIEMIAPRDAWAIIRIDDKLYVFRPPYREEFRREIVDRDKIKAACDHAFVSIDHECKDVDEAIDFLKDKYVEAMEARGIKMPTDEELRDTLRFASEDILMRFLERIEKEWIPQGKIDPAKRLTQDIMELEKVAEGSEIYKRASGIMGKL